MATIGTKPDNTAAFAPAADPTDGGRDIPLPGGGYIPVGEGGWTPGQPGDPNFPGDGWDDGGGFLGLGDLGWNIFVLFLLAFILLRALLILGAKSVRRFVKRDWTAMCGKSSAVSERPSH